MLRWVRRLGRNGTSTSLNLPPQALDFCGMAAGDTVTIEVTESRQIRVRQPVVEDFRGQAHLTFELRRKLQRTT